VTTLLKAARVLSLALLIPVLTGCSDLSNSPVSTDSDTSLLEFRLRQALQGFENAERSFGPSSNSDELVRNAGWLDRMAAEYREVEAIERDVIAAGGVGLSKLKNEMAQRFRRHLATFQSNSEYVDAMHQLEIARIWSEI